MASMRPYKHHISQQIMHKNLNDDEKVLFIFHFIGDIGFLCQCTVKNIPFR